jgi:alpha-tubulin suppressor-like RCC1 family protein
VGGLRCWGNNESGQLGDNSTFASLVPVDVQDLSPPVLGISAGAQHTCAIADNGAMVACWGDDGFGQLGNGSVVESPLPVFPQGLPIAATAALVTGANHTCALDVSGGLRCWGEDVSGQLGDGDTSSVSKLVPVDVKGLASGVAAVSAGAGHTCAVTAASGLLCWGLNIGGQIGDGTTVNAYSPTVVQGLTAGVVGVTGGGLHTCALTTAGGVKCWGSNANGQLGDNGTSDSHVPVDVPGLATGVVQVSAGQSHTCALTASGGVVCWGYNFYGQLGDDSTNDSHVPVAVAGLGAGVKAVSAGYYHTCALTSSGAVKCWGENTSGQLGNDSTTNSPVPVDVMGL